MMVEPAPEMVAYECRHGPPPVDPGGLFQQPLEQRISERRVGQRSQGRTDGVEPEDLATEQVAQGPRTARVVLVQELGLELGHVHPGRAFALAGLALKAQVEGL